MAEHTNKVQAQPDSRKSKKTVTQTAPATTTDTQQRAQASQDQMLSLDVLRLQQRLGNQAVSRLLGNNSSIRRIQPKLTVGSAFDPQEQEADQVAEQVMSRAGSATSDLQREDKEELQAKPLARTISRQAQPQEDEDIQAKGSILDSFTVGDDVEGALESSKGAGSPLSPEVRGFMEPRFGADFSNVSVHTDSQSAHLNRQLGAQAFTRGQDIYMGEGSFDPATAGGKQLLAHELTHTIQQTGGIQRLAVKSGLLKGYDQGTKKTFFGLRTSTTTWGDLIAAVEAYENAAGDKAKEKAALEKIMKYGNSWLEDSDRKKVMAGDDQKKEAIEKLLEEAKYETSYKTDLFATPEKAADVGKDVFNQSRQKASSQTVKAVKNAKEEMYATGNERVRQLYGVLTALKTGKLTLNYRAFELVQSLLSGGEGLPALYEEFKKQANPGDTSTLSKDLEIFKSWKSSPNAELSVEYLQKIAETGEIDPQYRLMFNLGQVDGGKVNGTYALEIFEKYFNTGLLTNAVPSSGFSDEDRNKQIDELKKKRDDLRTFLAGKNFPMPGDSGWRMKTPWFWVNGTRLDQIDLTMKYVTSIIAAGEQRKTGGKDLKDQQADPTLQANAKKVTDDLVNNSIQRLLGYMKAMRGRVYTTDEEQNEIIEFVDKWKQETLLLEEKFGLDKHTIGKKVIDDKLIGAWSGKGLGRDQISHILDIVSGQVGNIYQTIGKYKKDANATQPTDEGATKVAQAIALHNERQLVVTTASDINSLADDLVEIGKADPNALLAYLLSLKQFDGRWLTPADFKSDPATTPTFPADKRGQAIDAAMNALEGKLGIRKLNHEYVQLRREKRAALEKIVAIFRFGSGVVKDGKVYIAIRQALTDRTYRNKSILQGIVGITDTDRAMIRADAELRMQMDDAFKDDPKDKAKVEGILGFKLSTTTSGAKTYEGSAKFAGGLSADTGKKIDTDAVSAPKNTTGDIDYPAVQQKWAAVFTNTYHTFAQQAAGTGVLKAVGRGAAIGLSLGAAKFIMKSKPDTKALLSVAYQAQEDIRKLVSEDGKIPSANKDAAITDHIKGVSQYISTVAKMKGEDAAIKDWFENGKSITIDKMVTVGLGVVGADVAYLLEIVENTAPDDLLRYFADTHTFDQLYNQFNLHIEAAKTATNDADIRSHYDRAVDLQTKLLAYAPGVNLDFVHRLENTASVRAETRRQVVDKIYEKLASAYNQDKDFQSKLNDVRAKVAEKDTRADTKVKTGQAGPKAEADLSLGSMKTGMRENEFRANAEQVQEQQRMGNTKALRGISMRLISGKKAALMESRAAYLGSGRRTMETKAKTNVELEALEKSGAEAESKRQAAQAKMAAFDDAIAEYTRIETQEETLANKQKEADTAKNNISSAEKMLTDPKNTPARTRGVQVVLSRRRIAYTKLLDEIKTLSDDIRQARAAADTKIAANGLLTPTQDKNLGTLSAGREGAQDELISQEQNKQKAGLEKQGKESTYDLELSNRVKDMSASRQDFDKKQAEFLALREKVKTIVNMVIQLLIAAVMTAVSAATMGAGAAAAIPIWAGIIVSLISKGIEKVIEYAFDPESVTLVETAYDLISTVIVSGITAAASSGFAALSAIGLDKIGGKLVASDLGNKMLSSLIEGTVDNLVGGVVGSLDAGIRSAIMTGDGEADAMAKLKETLGIGALTKQLVSFGADFMVEWGTTAGITKIMGEDFDTEGGYYRSWLGLDDDTPALEKLKQTWAMPDLSGGLTGEKYGKTVAEGYLEQLASMTYSLSSGLIQNAITRKKNNISASTMEVGGDGSVSNSLDVEAEEAEGGEKSEDESAGAVHTAVESLFTMGSRIGQLADDAKAGATVAASQPTPDTKVIKQHADTVNTLETILNNTFNSKLLDNLHEATSEDSGKIFTDLPKWKKKVADAKAEISTLVAKLPAQKKTITPAPVSAPGQP